MIPLSPGACLREAASAKAGERGGEGAIQSPPSPQSSPIKGRIILGNFSRRWEDSRVTNPS